MAKGIHQFQTIRAEGALFPPDILQRIASLKVEGATAEAYHLQAGTKISEAISQSWNALLNYWKTFQEIRETIPDEDTGTKATNEHWLLPLFKELGYGRLLTQKSPVIDERIYPVERFYNFTPIHLIGCNLPLDRRTKGARGAATSSPHSMVQEFLNRSENHLWAFLSNGLQLRILRDNVSLSRQAFVEFDLESMMEGEVYADFAILWLLCHQSRVESEKVEHCWLEKWSQLARDQGARILSDLRNGVAKAIEALGQGFIGHPYNDRLRQNLQESGELSKEDFYRQLLRVVYRLIFLFVAEDRELLHPPGASEHACELYDRFYSTRRLRELALRIRGSKHSDLWHGLSLVFHALGRHTGCSELGLSGLGSFLWRSESTKDLLGPSQVQNVDPNSPVEPVYITNDDLLLAIRALAYVEQDRVLRSVDYRNLGSEELGSVYESLLELHPIMHIEAKSFELSIAAGNERKTTGSYYTPDSLVQCLLDSALEPVVQERLQGKKGDEAAKAVLDIKVCDPACGSGHFLIAAAHRLARHLARIRTGEAEPSPEDYQHALRDVIGNCIHGVDINPMATELCKVSLWMEALEPGKPLSFLEHRIRCGNSLLGTTPRLLSMGIPDDAFKPIEGDEKAICQEYKKKNRDQRSGQQYLFDEDEASGIELGNLAASFMKIDTISDDDIEGIQKKQRQYVELIKSDNYKFVKLLPDAWCAAFVWKKTKANRDQGFFPVTQSVLDKIKNNPHSISKAYQNEIESYANQYQFFHWHLAFPNVFQLPQKNKHAENEHMGWNGGFDVVLGNPPWERIKLQEKEWFATRNPEIANAANASERKRLIQQLKDNEPSLLEAFLNDIRKAEGESHIVRNSGRFPLCGRGDINTYSIFAETKRNILSAIGRVGCIVPSGIATDDTTKAFFQNLMDTRSLSSLYDFENRNGIFPGVHRSYKFSLLTLTGVHRPAEEGAEFVFFALDVSDIREEERRFTLSTEDIALLNPNTKTCPIFRSKRDAELTKYIYRRVPVLIKDGDPNGNPWGIKFMTMFHMANDSHLFRTREQLEREGYELKGNVFEKDSEKYLPLYEAKMIHHFDHRWATYENGATREVTLNEKKDPNFWVKPRYWVSLYEIWYRTAKVPKEVKDAHRDNDRDQLTIALMHWLLGYHHNRESIPYHKYKIWSRYFNIGSDINLGKSKQMELDYPLNEEALSILEYTNDPFQAAWELFDISSPGWLIGWRDITNTTNERTVISSIMPLVGVGHKIPLFVFNDIDIKNVISFHSCLNSYSMDYITRQKLGGTSLTYFILKQFTILTNVFYIINNFVTKESNIDWIKKRTSELIYTDWSYEHLIAQISYRSCPFIWDEDRRFLIRCELDAMYFHLYLGTPDEWKEKGSPELLEYFPTPREAVEYIMETFPIVKRKDEREYNEYRTKRVILEIYDEMQKAIDTGQPYQTRLDPPPGPPEEGLPEWNPGEPKPANWPPHIHPPRWLWEEKMNKEDINE